MVLNAHTNKTDLFLTHNFKYAARSLFVHRTLNKTANVNKTIIILSSATSTLPYSILEFTPRSPAHNSDYFDVAAATTSNTDL